MGMFDFSKWAELRDDFAIAAMKELMHHDPEGDKTPYVLARHAFAIADAMMYQRSVTRYEAMRKVVLGEQGIPTGPGIRRADGINVGEESHTAHSVESHDSWHDEWGRERG